jgi:alkylglycerol monooxygenase
MDHFFGGLNFAGFRRMFYLTTPNESSFENLESTPHYIDQAVPWFLLFIALEISYSTYKGKKNYYKANDALTSIGAGILQQSVKVIFHGLEFSLACWIYEHYAIVRLPWDSPWTWIVAFLSVDFTYYWFHRAVHEVNFLWGFHQMHHSSQYYNLSTALRQGMFQQYSSMWFNLPEAFIVPPSAHMVHLALNTVYQFWIHTQLIKSLGPLEYIINTPSHHRVHHGRNPYCIDKNYAGTLIIWDRLFGTFQAEKPEEPVAYGLVHNVNTFDQIYCQLFHFKYVLFEKFPSMKTFGDKVKSLIYGPGWFPGTPRLGNFSDLPPVESPVQIYDQKYSKWVPFYGFIQLSVTNFIYMTFAGQREDLSFVDALSYFLFIALSLQAMSAFFDKKSYAPYLELARCAALYYWFFPKIWPPNSFLHAFLHIFLSGSTALWLVKVLSLSENGENIKKSD